MKNLKITKFIAIVVIVIISFAFIGKTGEDEVKNNVTKAEKAVQQGTNKILIGYPQFTSESEKAAARQCVAAQIGTRILSVKKCKTNTDADIIQVAHNIVFGPTVDDGNQDGEIDDTTLDQSTFSVNNFIIYLSDQQVFNIGMSCGTLNIAEGLDCSDIAPLEYGN